MRVKVVEGSVCVCLEREGECTENDREMESVCRERDGVCLEIEGVCREIESACKGSGREWECVFRERERDR